MKVFQILQSMTSGTSLECSVKIYHKTRNIRSTYLYLYQHIIGLFEYDKIFEYDKTYVMKGKWN